MIVYINIIYIYIYLIQNCIYIFIQLYCINVKIYINETDKL